MKKLMRIACGILIALSPANLLAQSEGVYLRLDQISSMESYGDTLLINLEGNNKALFIGDDFAEMKKYTKADSIKTLFITDWEKALAAGSLKPETQKVFYFVDGKGGRRLKAESPEYSDNSVNVPYEMKRLQLGLARYEYRVYDMTTGYRMEFYLDDPAQLKTVLGGVSITDALAYAQADLKKDMNRNYKVELTAENNSFKTTGKKGKRSDILEVVPSFGVGLLGNTIAPVVGSDMWLMLTDKYAVPTIKCGVGFSVFPFFKMSGHEITGASGVYSYDLKFAMNLSEQRAKPYWLGLTGGMMVSDLHAYNKKVKVGFMYEGTGPFNYSFDVMFLSNKTGAYGLTVKLPF